MFYKICSWIQVDRSMFLGRQTRAPPKSVLFGGFGVFFESFIIEIITDMPILIVASTSKIT